MSGIYLPLNASRRRTREAQRAREHRAEIVRELSWGRISRRDLVKWGLFTSAGLLAPIRGLSPFAPSLFAQTTGIPRSPMFGVGAFTQPMPRFDVLPRSAVDSLSPSPTAEANQTQHVLDDALGGGMGPIEGRPPGPAWAHQMFDQFFPQVAFEVSQQGARANHVYRPEVPPTLNSSIDPTQAILPRFHPGLPIQRDDKVWTFNGTVPPKLVKGRYGEPILFRHHNRLPADVTQNGGFGRHTITTHEHNGHHGSENDGFTGAFFFPGQFYDYHWPIVLAGHFSINADATDWNASKPIDGPDKLVRVPGDWHETMSSHWFHDHMFSFTEQNVYKGNAAMFNIYSAKDRGAEDIFAEVPDGSGATVNLRLPSGRAEDSGTSWGNLHYDVNLMLADKAWDSDGQLTFDIFNFDGFLGDVMTVNLAYKPYFEVESRKYRFRILNASVARFYKLALVKDGSTTREPMIQIANDGNLLPHPVKLLELDELGIAERYDIVIDFSQYEVGQHLKLVNVLTHFDEETGTLNGRKPTGRCSLAEALSGTSPDPCVGSFLEFRVVRKPAKPDVSLVPDTLIPNPEHSGTPLRERLFEFGRGAKQTTFDPVRSGEGPWGIRTDGGEMLTADFGRISAAPRHGTREIWRLKNGGGGWDHPIHIHFEEALILARNGSAANVPPWERGRKDVFRLRPGESVTISIQFRDWTGMFMEHCHNTTHEDSAMLMRWEIDERKEARLVPLQTPYPTPRGVFFQDPVEILPTASR